MVLRRVKGEEGVGEVSRAIFHSGGGGGWEDWEESPAGRLSVGPRCRAPPVRGEGMNGFVLVVVVVLAGWWGGDGFGGSRDEGSRVDRGTAGIGVHSTVRLAALSNRRRSLVVLSNV